MLICITLLTQPSPVPVSHEQFDMLLFHYVLIRESGDISPLAVLGNHICINYQHQHDDHLQVPLLTVACPVYLQVLHGTLMLLDNVVA